MEMEAEAFVDFKEAVGGDAAKEVIQIADGVGAYDVFVTAPAAFNICVDFIGERVGAVIICRLASCDDEYAGYRSLRVYFQESQYQGITSGESK
jgi:propanol-preferring alcohol dehydrogenase